MEDYISNLEKRKVNVTMAVSPRVRIELEKLARDSGSSLSEFLRDHVVTFCLDGKQLQEYKEKERELKDELASAYEEIDGLNEKTSDLEAELTEARKFTGNDVPEGERVARLFEERNNLIDQNQALQVEIDELNAQVVDMEETIEYLTNWSEEKIGDYKEANNLYEQTENKLNQVCNEVVVQSYNRLKQLMNRMCKREYWSDKGLKKQLIREYLEAFYAKDYKFDKDNYLKMIEEIFEKNKPMEVTEAEKRLAEISSQSAQVDKEMSNQDELDLTDAKEDVKNKLGKNGN